MAVVQLQACSNSAGNRGAAVEAEVLASCVDMLSVHAKSAHAEYTYVSPSCVALTGYAPQELLGMSSCVHVHPEDMPLWTSWMAEAADEGTAVCDFRLQRKDGEVAWVEAAAAAAACGTVCVTRDITERKAAEADAKRMMREYASANEAQVGPAAPPPLGPRRAARARAAPRPARSRRPRPLPSPLLPFPPPPPRRPPSPAPASPPPPPSSSHQAARLLDTICDLLLLVTPDRVSLHLSPRVLGALGHAPGAAAGNASRLVPAADAQARRAIVKRAQAAASIDANGGGLNGGSNGGGSNGGNDDASSQISAGARGGVAGFSRLGRRHRASPRPTRRVVTAAAEAEAADAAAANGAHGGGGGGKEGERRGGGELAGAAGVGRVGPVSATARVVRDESGAPLGLLAVRHDHPSRASPARSRSTRAAT